MTEGSLTIDPNTSEEWLVRRLKETPRSFMPLANPQIPNLCARVDDALQAVADGDGEVGLKLPTAVRKLLDEGLRVCECGVDLASVVELALWNQRLALKVLTQLELNDANWVRRSEQLLGVVNSIEPSREAKILRVRALFMLSQWFRHHKQYDDAVEIDALREAAHVEIGFFGPLEPQPPESLSAITA